MQRFDDLDAFRRLVEPFLMREEAVHNLLLGLLGTLRLTPDIFGSEVYLGAVEERGEVVAAAVMTAPFPLVVSLCDSDAAMRLLARDVFAFRADTPGVNAPVPAGLNFARAWQAVTGRGYSLSRRDRCYRLDKVLAPTGVSGTLRRATEGDLALLTDWQVAFAAEAVPTEETAPRESVERSIRLRLELPPESRGIFVWEDAGRPVCMAGYGNPTPNSLRIGPVYTPPELRRRGYATACTAGVARYILESGKSFCTLFADVANPTSNHIYQQIGFVPACDADQYLFD